VNVFHELPGRGTSDRRQRRGETTKINNRKVKGKKGIGKFAGLMAASSMKLETWTRGKKCSFSLSNRDFDSVKDIEKIPINLIVENCSSELRGTTVTLSNLHQNLTFPDPDKLRQLLLQDYGREEDFEIKVNDKLLGIDDIQGSYTKYNNSLPLAGDINLEFTVSNQKAKLKQPGISIRVGGKAIGKPRFFGLDKAEDFPQKLLDKIYGEIEVDGLSDHVTADWGALVENSNLYKEVTEHIQPIIREKIKSEYGREINLARSEPKSLLIYLEVFS